MNRKKGFSLIELLIVVAIILIIAAVAIPNLLRSRIAANESSAVASVRSISTAEQAYAAAYPTQGFAPTLSSLGGTSPCAPTSTSACLIDDTLSTGTKSGYSFAAAGGDPSAQGANTTYAVGAAPVTYNQTGVRMFCAIQDGVVRYDPNTGSSTTPPDASTCPTMAAMQ
jgi:type IV pilus assembly protein PilA